MNPLNPHLATATIWGHLDALRQTLILSFLSLLIGIGLCSFFYQPLFHWMTHPLKQSYLSPENLLKQEIKRERLFNKSNKEIIYLPSEAVFFSSPEVRKLEGGGYALPPESFLDVEAITEHHLVLFGPTEGILTAFKVCFWLGFLVSSPFWLSLVLRFLIPALHPHEKKWISFFLTGTLLALLAGFCCAYFVTVPYANQKLASFNASIGLNFWSLSQYLDYTLMMIVANGVAFEIGLLLFFLVHLKILSVEWMQTKRRHMILLAFILGALLTPPDVPTQLMLALPLIGFYEMALLYAKIRSFK